MVSSATQAFFPVCSLAGNWWAFVLRGILALVIAVLAGLMPASAILALAIVFGAFSLVDGVFSLVAAVKNIRAGEKWGWLLFSGVLGIATGVVVVIAPFVASFALALFIWWMLAFWSLSSGVMQIVAAIRLRKEIKGEIWLALAGLFSVLVGGLVVWMLLTMPLEAYAALGWVIAFYAAVFGTMMLMLGLRLRRLHKEQEKPEVTNAEPQAS